jgi:dihydropyrimidinase
VNIDLLIENGTVVHENGLVRADVAVSDGRIIGLLDGDRPVEAERTVDATGLHVLPGVIDAHTHCRTWSKHCDDFQSMNRSAAHGGVTTTLTFITGMHATPLTLLQRVGEIAREASETAYTDYDFHVALVDEPSALEDLQKLLEQGVRSFKMFMTYRERGFLASGEFIFRAMRLIGRAGGIAMIHAEDGDIIDTLTSEVRDAGVTGHEAYVRGRPNWTEATAARRALELAEHANCPVYFVHVSTAEALKVLQEAKQRGQEVYIETCPHYLLLTDELAKEQGALAKIAPPIRFEADRASLLEALRVGAIDVVGSDHSAFSLEQKDTSLHDFADIPVGAPGVETILPMTWRAIAAAGGSISDLARVLSSAPARIFGLERKGRIAVGFDADFTLVDLETESVVDGSRQHNNSGYSMYDGWTSPLSVRASFVRGRELLKEQGTLSIEPGGGQWISGLDHEKR